MKAKQKALSVSLLASLTLIAGCGGGFGARQAAEQDPVMQAHLTRTVLEAHKPEVVAVEARLALAAQNGTQGLSAQEYAQIQSFATDYVNLGRGNVVISVPADSGNAQTAALIAQEAQRALYAGGVDFSKISGGAYQTQGQSAAPVMLVFSRYDVKPIECKPWSEYDPRKTASNLPNARFGCAQNANLAAMVADPGDLLGDRRETPRDALSAQVGIEKRARGEVEKVSGAVAGGTQ
jgi:pilus assembly protein CpaD